MCVFLSIMMWFMETTEESGKRKMSVWKSGLPGGRALCGVGVLLELRRRCLSH